MLFGKSGFAALLSLSAKSFSGQSVFHVCFCSRKKPRLRWSWGCYSGPAGAPGASLLVGTTQLHSSGFDMRVDGGQC